MQVRYQLRQRPEAHDDTTAIPATRRELGQDTRLHHTEALGHG